MKTQPDVVVMSSKGQIVVPKELRKAVQADAGTEFIVYGEGDALVFKKIKPPVFSLKEFERIVASNEKRLRKAGYLSESAVQKLVCEAIDAVRSQQPK